VQELPTLPHNPIRIRNNKGLLRSQLSHRGRTPTATMSAAVGQCLPIPIRSRNSRDVRAYLSSLELEPSLRTCLLCPWQTSLHPNSTEVEYFPFLRISLASHLSNSIPNNHNTRIRIRTTAATTAMSRSPREPRRIQ